MYNIITGIQFGTRKAFAISLLKTRNVFFVEDTEIVSKILVFGSL